MPEVELLAVQYPGRSTHLRQPPYDRLEPLLSGIETALEPLLDIPFVFFGHSMGATIAFELARRSQAANRQLPKRLFLSGRSAPNMPPTSPTTSPPTHKLSDRDFVEELRALNGTPSEILDNNELMEVLLPILRADFHAIETWEHRDSIPLKIPLTVFGGLSDEDTPVEHLDGWAEHTTEGMTRHMLPGDHFFLSRQYPAMLAIINRALHDEC